MEIDQENAFSPSQITEEPSYQQKVIHSPIQSVENLEKTSEIGVSEESLMKEGPQADKSKENNSDATPPNHHHYDVNNDDDDGDDGNNETSFSTPSGFYHDMEGVDSDATPPIHHDWDIISEMRLIVVQHLASITTWKV